MIQNKKNIVKAVILIFLIILSFGQRNSNKTPTTAKEKLPLFTSEVIDFSHVDTIAFSVNLEPENDPLKNQYKFFLLSIITRQTDQERRNIADSSDLKLKNQLFYL